MNNDLEKRIKELEDKLKAFEFASTIPLTFEQALRGRGFVKNDSNASVFPVTSGGTGVATLTGIVKANGTSVFSAIVPLSGTHIYYVSDSSGGAVNRKLTFNNGVLTAQT